MKRRAKIILVVIIIVAILMAIMYFISVTKEKNITGDSILKSSVKGEKIDKEFLDNHVTEVVSIVNKNEKYLQFINNSKYNSMNLIIDKKSYCLEYDSKSKKIIQVEPKETDFTMKVSTKKFKKTYDLYEEGKYKEAGMKVMGDIPRKVKINLFKQCMETDWCRNGHL